MWKRTAAIVLATFILGSNVLGIRARAAEETDSYEMMTEEETTEAVQESSEETETSAPEETESSSEETEETSKSEGENPAGGGHRSLRG